MEQPQPMTGAERVAALEATLARLLGMVSAVDSRAGFVLALDTAMLGVLAGFVPRAAGWDVAGAILSSIAGLGLTFSILSLSLAAIPRTKGPRGSMVFFEGIASRDLGSYVDEFAKRSLEDHARDLAQQCHRNGEIARSKFAWLQRALFSLYASVLPWAIAVYLLYRERS